MFLHHMRFAYLDISFITETWVNNGINLDSMMSQAKQAGYNTIISHRYTNRKGGGLMYIRISALNIQKVRTIPPKN